LRRSSTRWGTCDVGGSNGCDVSGGCAVLLSQVMSRSRLLTSAAASVLLVACTSLSGLTGGADGGIARDGGNPEREATTGHEAGRPDVNVPKYDAGHDGSPGAPDGMRPESGTFDAPHDADSGRDAGHDAGTKPDVGVMETWGTLKVVQSVLSAFTSPVALPSATTAGNLLVTMTANGNAPSGSGWVALHSDANGDSIYVWPDNPGGEQAFVITGGTDSVIIVELSGAPPSILLDSEKDTGVSGSSVTSLSLSAAAPTTAGELELLYLDTANASSASVSGWTYLGTDGNTNYGWWRVATSGTLSVTADYTPSCGGSLLFASVKAN
jgi:hypothetical protein